MFESFKKPWIAITIEQYIKLKNTVRYLTKVQNAEIFMFYISDVKQKTA